jgi:putative pyruvate formate lyase activating enzyme
MVFFPRPSPKPDRRFVIEDYEPVYLETWQRGLLEAKVECALDELKECRICPRNCGVDRMADEQWVCRTGRHAIVSSAKGALSRISCTCSMLLGVIQMPRAGRGM